MLIVPLQPVPYQALTVPLAGQACQITIAQKFYGLFLDLRVNNSLVVGGALCVNKVRIVRSAYLPFIGDLAFLDTQGSNDPTYDGLGGRFKLLYLAPADVAMVSA